MRCHGLHQRHNTFALVNQHTVAIVLVTASVKRLQTPGLHNGVPSVHPHSVYNSVNSAIPGQLHHNIGVVDGDILERRAGEAHYFWIFPGQIFQVNFWFSRSQSACRAMTAIG
jgi:hypothetical protein